MADKDLTHKSSYEWSGQFWFPDEKEKKLSGTLSYTPENGIRIFLFIEAPTPFQKQEYINRKIMLGRAHRNNTIETLTLFNVLLGSPGLAFSESGANYNFTGHVDSIVLNKHLMPDDVKRLKIQFDDHYNSFYSYASRPDEDIIKFGNGESLTTNNGWGVSLEAASIGSYVNSTDLLDSVFWSNDDHDLMTLKETLTPYFDKHSLFKRNKTNLVTIFSKEGQSYADFLSFEYIWRLFFELLEDHPISIEKAWVNYEFTSSDGKSSLTVAPFLSGRFIPKKQRRSSRFIAHRDISFYDFSKETYDLSVLKEAFDKWFELNDSDTKRSIISQTRRCMDIDNSFEDTMPYAAIVAELEYFLSELNSPSLTSLQPDIFIKNYASQEWKNLVIDTIFPLPHLAICVDNFLGKNLKNIRNSIIHPVDDERRNRQQHRNIRNNPSKLHFCYACLGGLYLKASLEHLQIGTESLREKYCQSYIENHAHVSFVDYE